jgi:hypothetical protein
VTLKTLPAFDAQRVARFKREFRALADVAHDNLVSLYELFVDDETCAFTMEAVEGTPSTWGPRAARPATTYAEVHGWFVHALDAWVRVLVPRDAISLPLSGRSRHPSSPRVGRGARVGRAARRSPRAPALESGSSERGSSLTGGDTG